MPEKPRRTFSLLAKHLDLLDQWKNENKMCDANDSEVLRHLLDHFMRQDELALAKALDRITETLGLISRQLSHMTNQFTKSVQELSSLDKKGPELLLLQREVKNLITIVKDMRSIRVQERAVSAPEQPKKRESKTAGKRPSGDVSDGWFSTLNL